MIRTAKLLLATFVAVFAFGFTGPATTYTANPAESVIKWKGEKVTGEHFGTISLKEGNFTFADGKLTGGSFVVDMTSIVVEDIEDPTYNAKLAGHLKSADFFGVEEFPTATFVITNAISRGTPGDYKVIGDITIKGITKEIRFLANITEENGQARAKADIELDRSEFNVRYGSGSFFDDLGDKTIYDEFFLTIDIVGAAS
ncbi:MAG: YceI family protein [Bacteroidetes bacterium]|nr:MAG: YceI family protein [Bacteroidota bacterium]